MPCVVVDRADIWFEDIGAGEAVLLAHGGLMDPMTGARF